MENNFIRGLKEHANAEPTAQDIAGREATQRQKDLRRMCDFLKNCSYYLGNDETIIRQKAQEMGCTNLDDLDFAILLNANGYIGGKREDKVQSVVDNIDKIAADELPLARIVETAKETAKKEAKDFQSTEPERFIGIPSAIETVKKEIEQERTQ